MSDALGASIVSIRSEGPSWQLRWNDGVLQQLFTTIVVRVGGELERTEEWRDVPQASPTPQEGE